MNKLCFSKNRKGKNSSCLTLKPLTDFYKSKITTDGYDNLCKSCRLKVKSAYRDTSKGKAKIKEISMRPEYIKARTEYSKTHKSERNIYEKNRRRSDSNHKLRISIRTRTNNFLRSKGLTKHKRMVELLGCSWNQLKEHLEKQFQPGMTWENHGRWHIDHIKPLAIVDLTNKNEFEKVFHYSNLQPMWAADNIRKKDKY